MTWCEPGGDATFDTGLFKGHGSGGALSVVTDHVHGTHVKSLQSSGVTSNVYNYLESTSTQAGGRISVWIYINAFQSNVSDGSLFALEQANDGNTIYEVRISKAGILRLYKSGAPATQIGTDGSTLSTGIWYRLTLAWTITSTTVNHVTLFKNGVSDIDVVNNTLTTINSNDAVFGNFAGANNSPDVRYSDIYCDNSTSLTDPGNIWVTAKRTFSNGTTNGYTTQIGAGGSGYGTGHSPQVNERPQSDTNGWSIIGAGSAITEEYNIENQATGDINITGATIVNYMGWIRSKALASETGNIIVNGVSSNISLTSTTAYFTQIAGSSTYPAGTGSDIGEITSTALTTVSLYEAGVIVAYIPSAGAKFSSTLSMLGVG